MQRKQDKLPSWCPCCHSRLAQHQFLQWSKRSLWRPTFPPSITKPDLALQGKKEEKESHFLEQGSETGITPLRSYFQPEISCILGDDAPSGTGEPGWPALHCQKINPFSATNLFSFHRQPSPGEGLCVRIYTCVR